MVSLCYIDSPSNLCMHIMKTKADMQVPLDMFALAPIEGPFATTPNVDDQIAEAETGILPSIWPL